MEEWKETNWGRIPSHWDIVTIKEGTNVVTDYVANGSFASLAANVTYRETEDYAVLIRLVDFNNNFKGDFVFIDKHAYDFLSKSQLLGGEIIISNVGANVGTVFKCPKLKYKMSLAPNSIMVKFNGCTDFYYYWLKSPYGQYSLKSIVTGSAQPKFNKTNFKDLKIPVPPLDEQQKIANILSSLDDKIEVNRRINEQLEEMAQALFKSWFVDFEPFKEQPFVETELGMIPEGWKVGKSEDFYKITIGKTPPRKEQEWFTKSDEDVKWVSISDMGNCGCFISDSSEYLTSEAIKKFNIGIVPEDTILLSFKLTVGRVAIAMCSLTTNEAIARFELSDDTLREYTYLMLKQYNYANLGSTSSIATAVNSKIIKQMRIMIPSIEVLQKFSKVIRPIFENIKKNQQEILHLTTLRDTLLPKLMSGEIKV